MCVYKCKSSSAVNTLLHPTGLFSSENRGWESGERDRMLGDIVNSQEPLEHCASPPPECVCVFACVFVCVSGGGGGFVRREALPQRNAR